VKPGVVGTKRITAIQTKTLMSSLVQYDMIQYDTVHLCALKSKF